MTNKRKIGSTIIGKPFMVFSLMCIAAGLPVSPFLLSVGQFLLVINFLVEGNFIKKWQNFKSNKILWLFLLLPVVHLLGLIHTTDFHFALRDLKIKVPLLIFPLIIGLSEPLSKLQLRIVLFSFVFGAMSATVVTLSVLLGIYKIEITNVRDISFIISHIRYSLMLVVALAIVLYYSVKYNNKIGGIDKVGVYLLIAWFLYFIIYLRSFTAWIIMLVVPIILFFIYYRKIKSIKLRVVLASVLIGIASFTLALFLVGYYNFFLKSDMPNSENVYFSKEGNRYKYYKNTSGNENGYEIFAFVSEQELKREWNKVSALDYNSKTDTGGKVKFILIRYMTSKGLKKDAEGFKELNDNDIKNIEKGYTSYIYDSHFIPYIKVYELMWELANYKSSGDPNAKSVAQRIEYVKTSKYIIQNNFWWGVGTGDLKLIFKQTYDTLDSRLKPENRHRAHNQFLTLLIAFGFFGFIVAMCSIFGPWILSKNRNVFFVGFMFLVLLSMLNEDTLETQAGVTFYIFFYTVLLFNNKALNE